MLNYNFVTCAKAEIKDLTVCIVVNEEKISKLHCDFDHDRPMPNVKLAQAIFKYQNMFKFQMD